MNNTIEDLIESIVIVGVVFSGALLIGTFIVFILEGITPIFIRFVVSSIVLSLITAYFVKKSETIKSSK